MNIHDEIQAEQMWRRSCTPVEIATYAIRQAKTNAPGDRSYEIVLELNAAGWVSPAYNHPQPENQGYQLARAAAEAALIVADPRRNSDAVVLAKTVVAALIESGHLLTTRLDV